MPTPKDHWNKMRNGDITSSFSSSLYSSREQRSMARVDEGLIAFYIVGNNADLDNMKHWDPSKPCCSTSKLNAPSTAWPSRASTPHGRTVRFLWNRLQSAGMATRPIYDFAGPVCSKSLAFLSSSSYKGSLPADDTQLMYASSPRTLQATLSSH